MKRCLLLVTFLNAAPCLHATDAMPAERTSMTNAPGTQIWKIELEESNELFANPFMGWQTFHHLADEEATLRDLSGSAYFRFYRRELERDEGRIDSGWRKS